jgi:geranylgeranylglycerol-phosphate geranylgeranyltransferase
MYASIPMIAFGIQSYNYEIIRIIIFSIITLYSGFFAALIWNDITDSDIDSVAHPDRPIPSGKISSKKFFAIALIFSASTFIFSILISFWCFILTGFSALFVTFHNKYLKKRVKFPAYSEIFTPIQWVVVAIFGYLAIWTALPQDFGFTINMPIFENIYTSKYELINMVLFVIFIYFTDNAHDLPEGIHDSDGDKKLGVKTYATSFGNKNAARISFTMFLISGILGVLLYLRTSLTLVFLIPFLCIWIYTLYHSYKLMTTKIIKEIKKNSWNVGRKGFNYYLFTFDLIFIDILIQLIIYYLY